MRGLSKLLYFRPMVAECIGPHCAYVWKPNSGDLPRACPACHAWLKRPKTKMLERVRVMVKVADKAERKTDGL